MQALAALLISLVGKVFAWQAAHVAQRIALITAFVVGFAAITLGMVVAIQALANGISTAFPSVGFVLWALPGNTATCIGLLLTARVVRMVWRYKSEVMRARLASW